MLPIGPVGYGDSPYSSPSSFAIEPTFLALEPLVEEGLLAKSDLKLPAREAARLSRGDCDFSSSRAFRMSRAAKAAEAFAAKNGAKSAEYKRFLERATWLPAWIDFVAGTDANARAMHAFIQFKLDAQWAQLRAYCAKRGIALIGDVPIFVTADSADVRANPELFRLQKNGTPEVLTGVPPDGFSKDGQLWGHPHYAWDAHRNEKFAWWISRIACAAERFDLVRIDHFIGFHNAYEVPAGAKTARKGEWRKAPGRELLSAMSKRFSNLPLIAEDLGALTPEVEALRDSFEFPGMKILQFAFADTPKNPYLPHNFVQNCLVYTGTHDNDTTVGWWQQAGEPEKQHVTQYLGYSHPDEVKEIHWEFIGLALKSVANQAIIPLQDLLGLDNKGRMNDPSINAGNWRWRYESSDQLTSEISDRLRHLTKLYNR
jgi:4-alpha-glucanotransferase